MVVDLTGKFYLTEELDEGFVRECVAPEYAEYAGRWVKNAYDPQFNADGKYDEQAAAAAETLDLSTSASASRARARRSGSRSTCTTIPTAGARTSRCSTTPRLVVHPHHGAQGAHDRAERHDPLEARIDGHGTLRQVARKPQRLEPRARDSGARRCRSGPRRTTRSSSASVRWPS